MSDLADRRRYVRIRVNNHRHLPGGMRDISLGGLSIELSDPVSIHAIRDFALTLGDGTEIVLRARVAHRHDVVRPDGRTVFITGVEFLADVTDQASLRPLRLAS